MTATATVHIAIYTETLRGNNYTELKSAITRRTDRTFMTALALGTIALIAMLAPQPIVAILAHTTPMVILAMALQVVVAAPLAYKSVTSYLLYYAWSQQYEMTEFEIDREIEGLV